MPDVQEDSHQIHLARADEYERYKRVLNAGRHPTFIGRDQYLSMVHNGGALIYTIAGEDVAVSGMSTRLQQLNILCVIPSRRGKGLGLQILRFLKPSFARVVESALPWFERAGFSPIGDWKQGRTLRTCVVVRSTLPALAGRLRKRLSRNAE